MSSSDNTGSGIASSVSNGINALGNMVNQAAETVMGKGKEAEKEGNKQIAKDSNASIGTRFNAATDAVGNFVDQKKHEGNAEAEGLKGDANRAAM